MRLIGLTVGKAMFKGLRLLGRTGSALPGRVVEKVAPAFLPDMLTQLPQGVIVVSGTNGKTTTTKLITKLLESQGLSVLTNPTGSNFVRGIISAVVDKAKWNGKLPYDIAVFEQDEAHAVHFARVVKPRGVLVLNIMRDQMDRFGEIDTTRQLLARLASAATEFVVLNANDERVSTIQPENAKAVWFGHAGDLQKEFLTDDQLYHAEDADFYQAEKPAVLLTGYDDTSVSLKVGDTPHRYQFQLSGGHNALNLAAALAVVYQVIPVTDTAKLAQAILTVEPAFGRGEMITLPSATSLTLQLIKNPGGFSQALRMLELKEYATIGIAINDDYPDGRDVSWLWDVDFSTIRSKVLCGGVRAADMANRLKYDEVKVAGSLDDITNYKKEFDALASKNDGEAILFCTYTAMLKLREMYVGASGGLDEV